MSLFRLILPALLLLLAAFSAYAQGPEQPAVAEPHDLEFCHYERHCTADPAH